MLNFVYPLAPSNWNEEIRYSLRSLCSNFKDPFEVYILGYKPLWMTGVTHIGKLDQSNVPTEFNLGVKTKWCLDNLQEPYIWIFDDVYILEPLYTSDIKLTTYLRDLNKTKSRGQNRWQKLLWNTYDRLRELNYYGYNFETHLPYYIEIEKLREVINIFKIIEGEHLLKTAYQSMFPYNEPIVEDRKIGYYNYNRKSAKNPNFNGYSWLNHDDYGMTRQLKEAIKSKFPKACKFEK